MRFSISLMFLFFSFQLLAQKAVEKSIDAVNISSIEIEGNEMFKINVSTSKVDFITLKTKIEGEYSDQIVVLAETKDETLIVSSKFQPLFKKDDDKLSAHKVVSIELELVIPSDLNVYIRSESASAKIRGAYKNLLVELAQGNCKIESFLGNATVNTINGKIEMNSNYATVEALSKTGSVFMEQLVFGNNVIRLNSINGNISVIKTK